MIWLKLILNTLLAIIIVHIQIKYSGPKYIYVTAVIIAFFAVFTSHIIDVIDQKNSDPKVIVTAKKIKEGEVLINISKKKKPVSGIRITLPILGKVLNIHDFSDAVDRRTVLKQVIGHQEKYSANNVEIDIENISRVEKFSYKILFEPIGNNDKEAILQKIREFRMLPISEGANSLEEALGLDRFSYSYEWPHKGDVLLEKKWILLSNNRETTKPIIETKGFKVTPNKVMSKSEVKQDYIDSIPIHKF